MAIREKIVKQVIRIFIYVFNFPSISYGILIYFYIKLFFLSKALPCILSQQCQNNGQCQNDNNGGYSCTCQPGFTGQNCEIGDALVIFLI
jgi:hypothetical protein